MKVEEITKEIESTLTEKRFIHSINVMEKCQELAIKHGVDVETAKMVGLTHDIAKEMKEKEMLKYVKENNIFIDEIERTNPKLLHAKIGAHICKTKYNFTESMCKAIEAHTTAKPNMDKLAKILYISDAISKERKEYYVETATKLADESLDKAITYLLKIFIEDCVARNKKLHPDAQKALDEYGKE